MNTKKFLLFIFNMVLFFALNTNLHAGCKETLAKLSLKNGLNFIKKQYKVFKETPTIYLFLKDAPKRKGLWFPPVHRVDDNTGLTKMLQYIPNRLAKTFTGKYYNFTPIQAVGDIFYDLPFRKMTNRLSRDGLVPRLYYTVPTTIGLSLYAYIKIIDPTFDEKLENNIKKDIKDNKGRLDFLIENDLRFKAIEKSAKSDKKNIHMKAYWQLLALNEYYNYLLDLNNEFISESPYKKKIKLDKINEETFINHILFKNLKMLLVGGVAKKRNGFFIPKSSVGEITGEKREKLFKLEHSLLLKYEYIASLFDKAGKIKPGQKNHKIFEHHFYKRLLSQNLSSVDLYYYMQEYAWWEYRFKKWEILGVKKYKLNSINEYTLEYLEIEDIESEILG